MLVFKKSSFDCIDAQRIDQLGAMALASGAIAIAEPDSAISV
jgi:hypothetical protein